MRSDTILVYYLRKLTADDRVLPLVHFFLCFCSRMTFAALAHSHRHSLERICFLLGHLAPQSIQSRKWLTASLDLHYFPRLQVSFLSLHLLSQTYTHRLHCLTLSSCVCWFIRNQSVLAVSMDCSNFTLQCLLDFQCTTIYHFTSLDFTFAQLHQYGYP